MDLVLLIGLPALLGTAYLIWNLCYNRAVSQQPEAQSRRREDARDWQRRFGAESLLTANFLQPTQNEILETLYLLDHLTPRWETGDTDETERHFLNELALNFPTLRKASCAFPLPFEESLPAVSSRAKSTGPRVREEDVAAKREEFRVARAHANALEQIVSGPAVPKVVTPGSLPFRVSNPEPDRRRGNPWPARLASAAVLGAVIFGVLRALPKDTIFKATPMTREVERPDGQETTVSTPDAVEPSPVVAETVVDHPAAVPTPETPVSPTTPESAGAATAATPDAVAILPPAATPDPQKIALNQQIAASQQRAVSKYPSLAVEGSEINLRFVFRYKALILQNSPRLLDPNWPEQLVEECATDSKSSLKRNALTQVLGTHH